MKRMAVAGMAILLLATPLAYGSADDANAGLEALSAGDYAGAVRLFSQALREGGLSQSDRELAFVKRGQAYLGEGRHDLALADLNQAVRLDPNDQEAKSLLEQAETVSYQAKLGEIVDLPPPARGSIPYPAVGLAWGQNGTAEISFGATVEEAEQKAVTACNRVASACKDSGLVARPGSRSCFVLTADSNNQLSYGAGPDLAIATVVGLQMCSSNATGCRLLVRGCNFSWKK